MKTMKNIFPFAFLLLLSFSLFSCTIRPLKTHGAETTIIKRNCTKTTLGNISAERCEEEREERKE